MAKMIATTQLIPKAYHNKPADVLVAFEFGRTLGLGYLQAVQNIAVVNGRLIRKQRTNMRWQEEAGQMLSKKSPRD